MNGAAGALTIRRILLSVLVILALLTGYLVYRSRPAYAVRVFRVPTGWGYDVLNHDNVLIHQPAIPGLAGEQGFASEAQARRVGERVISKIRQGQGMPTITQDDLRAMQISAP